MFALDGVFICFYAPELKKTPFFKQSCVPRTHRSAASAKCVKIEVLNHTGQDPTFTKEWGPRDPIPSKPSANTVT